MVDFSLSEEQELIQETARSFSGELRERLRAIEEAGCLPDDVLGIYAELGLAAIDLPEAVGGAALGSLTTCLAIEELAAGDLGAAYALPGFSPAARLVSALGSDATQASVLGKYLESPTWQGATAWNDGVEAVTATRCAEGYRLSGTKVGVERAREAGYFVVRAQIDDQAQLFVVGAGSKGLQVGEKRWKLGLLATPNADVSFADVVVSEEALLSDDADALLNAWFRIAVQTAAMQLGVARASHAYALQYTQERTAFGKPVAHFQAVAFMLADAAMLVDAARWSVWRAAWALDHGRDDAAEAVGQAVVNAYEIATRIVDDGVQLLGGAGYVFDHPVEKWMRDQKALSVTGVTPEAAEDLLTRCLLGESTAGDDLVASGAGQTALL